MSEEFPLTKYHRRIIFKAIVSGRRNYHKHPCLFGAHEPLVQKTARLCRLARKKKRLSQRELAHILGTHQTQIVRIESPLHNTSLHELEKYAAALGYFVKITFTTTKTFEDIPWAI